MEQEKIKQYLDNHDYITLGITKEELLQNGGARYFELLSVVENTPHYAAKFCNRLMLNFKNYTDEELWQSREARTFVQKLNAEFPFIFFLAEKENATLKVLTILECATSESQGEDFALDKERFNKFLKVELQNIVLMSQKAGFAPERAQSLMDDVYTYFGI